jgi:hypothetical protein
VVVDDLQDRAEAGVDRTTIATLKRVARDGAIAALEASRPGRRQHSAGESAELARLRGEVDRLQGAIVEQAIELAALRGKVAWG